MTTTALDLSEKSGFEAGGEREGWRGIGIPLPPIILGSGGGGEVIADDTAGTEGAIGLDGGRGTLTGEEDFVGIKGFDGGGIGAKAGEGLDLTGR